MFYFQVLNLQSVHSKFIRLMLFYSITEIQHVKYKQLQYTDLKSLPRTHRSTAKLRFGLRDVTETLRATQRKN